MFLVVWGLSVVERTRQQQRAEALVRQRMMDIYGLVNGYIDHIPPVLFHYDITFGQRRDQIEDFNSRVSTFSLVQSQ